MVRMLIDLRLLYFLAILRLIPCEEEPEENPVFIRSKFASSVFRIDKKLDVAAFRVVPNVSAMECLSVCLQHSEGDHKCKAFNYGERSCYLLNTFLCDKGKNHRLINHPGFKYYDLIDRPSEEFEYFGSKQCSDEGKCSSGCPKFSLIKSEMNYTAAVDFCLSLGAILATPKTDASQKALATILRKATLPQAWIGLRKNGSGIFYYVDGEVLDPEFDKWGPDQPNDSGGTQHCVSMSAELMYLWNDFECHKPLPFICQFVIV